ncbi:MAG: branched-chain amino acid transaminase [Patescibacteria group bacterium]
MKLKPTKYVWMDGKFVEWQKATIHLITHTFHYGTGSFEGVRFYDTSNGTAIFRLPEHIKRLFYSSDAIGIKIPFTQKQVCEAAAELIRKNKIKSGYIRPMAWYGEEYMGLDPVSAPVRIAIACWPWGAYLPQESVRIMTSSFIRIHPKSTRSDAKISGHYANSVQAVIEARKAGYDEALFLDFEGNVAEASGENIFMVKNGVLITPALGSILNGITRDSVLTLAKELGYKVAEKKFKLAELCKADEVFLTGTAAEIVPVREVDKQVIAHWKKRPVTRALSKAFGEAVAGRKPKWLTYVNG